MQVEITYERDGEVQQATFPSHEAADDFVDELRQADDAYPIDRVVADSA